MYGPCAGDVLPSVDSCATPSDEDCDGMAAPCTGAGIWAKAWGGNYDEYGTTVASDGAGNVVFAGKFSSSIDLGGGNYNAMGSPDLFLAKLDPGGAHLWSKPYIASGTDGSVTAVAVDDSGDVYMTGFYYGTTNFGSGLMSPEGGGDIFLVKLDAGDVLSLAPAGGFRWVRQWGNGYTPATLRIASDPLGDALLTAGFVGTLDLGGGPMTTASTFKHDIFVLKLSPAGAHVWSKRFGDSTQQNDYQHTLGIASSPSADVLITGYMGGVTDFGTGDVYANDPAATGDAFVAKLAP